MSIFHETMRDILEDVQKFLNITLQKEKLSAASITHKESLLIKIHHLRTEYPQLHLQLITEPTDDVGSTNPPPYIDMQGNVTDTEYVYSDTLADEYEICDSGENEGYGKNKTFDDVDSPNEYKEHGLNSIPACDLTNVIKCGYLEKKGKDRLGGWLNLFQKRFVVLRENLLVLYNKSTDKRPYCTLPLNGYDVRPVFLALRDGSKKEACFELVGPGKKTYQFVASNSLEAKEWIDAVQKILSNISHETQLSPGICSTVRTDNLEDVVSTIDKKSTHNTNNEKIKDDIYEMVEDGSTDTILLEEDELYEDADSEHINSKVDNGVFTVANVDNPLDWYVGLWDCLAGATDELHFNRGDVLHVIDKGYDDYKWWVAEINGHVGLVPKEYLMNAYEAV